MILHSHLYDMEIPGTKRFMPKKVRIGYSVELAEKTIYSCG